MATVPSDPEGLLLAAALGAPVSGVAYGFLAGVGFLGPNARAGGGVRTVWVSSQYRRSSRSSVKSTR